MYSSPLPGRGVEDGAHRAAAHDEEDLAVEVDLDAVAAERGPRPHAGLERPLRPRADDAVALEARRLLERPDGLLGQRPERAVGLAEPVAELARGASAARAPWGPESPRIRLVRGFVGRALGVGERLVGGVGVAGGLGVGVVDGVGAGRGVGVAWPTGSVPAIGLVDATADGAPRRPAARCWRPGLRPARRGRRPPEVQASTCRPSRSRASSTAAAVDGGGGHRAPRARCSDPCAPPAVSSLGRPTGHQQTGRGSASRQSTRRS